MLPRTIDKLRASLPGGNRGLYNIDGFSRRLLDALGVTEEQLLAVVASAHTDDDVAAWLREHGNLSRAAEEAAAISAVTIGDRVERPGFFDRYPVIRERGLPASMSLLEMLDADDAHTFA